MIGLGVANLAAAFFQGFPISSSSSRTPVAEAAGAKTQLTGVVGALAIALLLVLAPQLLQHLPHTALAAVVIASAIGLVEVSDLRRIYRIQRWEFWLSMACFAGVAAFGAIPGIALAIVIAVIEFLWDGWRPHSAVLGRVERVKGYHDIARYRDARLIPGLVLFRWDAPLFFANAELFHERVLDAVANSPTPVNWIVVAAEPVTSVDVTAADAVCELDDTLHAAGIELCFAEMKDPVKDKLKRFGVFTRFGEQTFFGTLGEASAPTARLIPSDGSTGRTARRSVRCESIHSFNQEDPRLDVILPRKVCGTLKVMRVALGGKTGPRTVSVRANTGLTDLNQPARLRRRLTSEFSGGPSLIFRPGRRERSLTIRQSASNRAPAAVLFLNSSI
jgi:anti-anti-sigma regulatory factor